MLIDIKKLFKKGSTFGRFEYLKIIWGLLFFPTFMIQLAIATPPNNNMLCYLIITIAIITLLTYWVIFWVATYKRFTNIFDNTIKSVIGLIVFIFAGIIKLLHILFSILLFIIPGKKQSDSVIPSKVFWITFPLLIMLFIFDKYAGFIRWIPSEAMANTLQAHDRIVINIFDKNYNRGDIIIHKTDKKGIVFIKRIIALPGEKVEIKTLEDGAKYIFINDKLLKEPYVKDIYDYPDCSEQMKCEPITVPENNYYVLGDNRGNSFDSRYYGTIDKSTIKGKASHIWFPIDRRKVFTTLDYKFEK